eukprot:SAG31_NODE_327_length_17650_cov_18.626574_9_plen_94_part_00
MSQIKAAEGLFESLPQGMLQTYILLKVFYCAGLDEAACVSGDADALRRLQVAGSAQEDATLPIMSLAASFLSTTMSIAMLPQDVFYKCVNRLL